jgi:hypothetical protein
MSLLAKGELGRRKRGKISDCFFTRARVRGAEKKVSKERNLETL